MELSPATSPPSRGHAVELHLHRRPARHGRRSARVRPPLRSQCTLEDAALSPGPAGLLGVAGDGRCHRGERRHRPASPPLSPDAPAREVGDEPDRRAPRVSDPVGGPARLSGDGFRRYRLSRAKAYFQEAAFDVAPARVRPSRWAGPMASQCLSLAQCGE